MSKPAKGHVVKHVLATVKERVQKLVQTIVQKIVQVTVIEDVVVHVTVGVNLIALVSVEKLAKLIAHIIVRGTVPGNKACAKPSHSSLRRIAS